MEVVPEAIVHVSSASGIEDQVHSKEEHRQDLTMGPILMTLVAEWKQGDQVLSKQGPLSG